MGNKFIYIDGYYIEDGAEFQGYKCKLGLDVLDNEDEEIFFYFKNLNEVKNFIKPGIEDFVITNAYFVDGTKISLFKEKK